jgi:hypothetical protein
MTSLRGPETRVEHASLRQVGLVLGEDAFTTEKSSKAKLIKGRLWRKRGEYMKKCYFSIAKEY